MPAAAMQRACVQAQLACYAAAGIAAYDSCNTNSSTSSSSSSYAQQQCAARELGVIV